MGAISRFEPRDPIAFGPLIRAVAVELWGEPNKRMSKATELRWGSQGARIVYPDTGAFKDTEADRSGGTLDLIQHATGVDRAGAMAWLADRGMIPAANDPQPRTNLTPRAANHAVRLDRGQRIVATFEFRQAGELLFRKHRIEPGRDGRPKSFAYDRPGPSGHWIDGQGERKAPYRADALAGADLIVMTEGEAKADRLTSWGYVTTSHKDWLDGFASFVRGKRVVILPDNDETGERLANKTALQVKAAEGHPLILRLPRLPDKGDVLDWDGSAAELARLIDGLDFPKPETFPIADLTAWARTEPTSKAFTMAGFIPAGEVTLFTGPGGSNKSTFGLQLCACSAAALPMLGVPVDPGPALYVTAEDEDRENHWRLRKIAGWIGTSLDRLAGKLHVVSLRGRLNNELATFDAEGRLHVAPAMRLLRATIEVTGSRLIVLDNVAHLFAGNENDRANVTAFVNLLYQLCRDLGVTVVLIGHPNKAGDSYSGSTAWLNAVRSQIVLERPKDSPDPDVRVLTLGKANYARQGEELAFRWHDFALVLDEVLPADTRLEMAATIQASAENAAFLTCLAAATRDRQAVSHNKGTNYAPTIFAAMPEAKRMSAEGFERAMQRLRHLQQIRYDQPLWRGPNRSMKQGIKLASECTDPPAPTPAPTLHEPPIALEREACTDLHAPTPLYTTYNPGAATRAAAPSWYDEEDPAADAIGGGR